MTTTTPERERDNTAGGPPILGALGAHPVGTGFGRLPGAPQQAHWRERWWDLWARR